MFKGTRRSNVKKICEENIHIPIYIKFLKIRPALKIIAVIANPVFSY